MKEKTAERIWGAVAFASWAALAASFGVEGAFAVATGGLGLVPEAAAAPELLSIDGLLLLTAIYTTNRWHKHRSLRRHLNAGGTRATHAETYKKPLTYPPRRRR